MSKLKSVLGSAPCVVGAIHSEASLRRALRLRPGSVDLLELRVDHFAQDPGILLRKIERLAFPLLVTARHPAEGGANDLSFARRGALFMQFLPFASVIDVELRSVKRLGSVLAMARTHEVEVVLSHHDFRATPSPSRLETLQRSAQAAGADIFKVAALTSTPRDLSSLLSLLSNRSKLPLSVMGMGALGKVSRLVFAEAGSVLNYGYLDRPNASGQWEATLLKQRLKELREE